MRNTDWAKKEIKLAKKRDDSEYAKGVYKSAYKAYCSLMEDGHTGTSLAMTKLLLNRLLEGKPLTSVTADDFVNGTCTRVSGIYKRESGYTDVNRVACVDPNGRHSYFGFLNNLVDELFPITMPYMPFLEPYKVYWEDLQCDPKNGDFDTIACFYILTPKGERVDVNRYWKEGPGGWIEINEEEYNCRKEHAV